MSLNWTLSLTEHLLSISTTGGRPGPGLVRYVCKTARWPLNTKSLSWSEHMSPLVWNQSLLCCSWLHTVYTECERVVWLYISENCLVTYSRAPSLRLHQSLAFVSKAFLQSGCLSASCCTYTDLLWGGCFSVPTGVLAWLLFPIWVAQIQLCHCDCHCRTTVQLKSMVRPSLHPSVQH